MNSHGDGGYQVRITEHATKASFNGSSALTDEVVKAGETLTVIENGKMATYTTGPDDTAQTAVQNLRSEIDRNGLNLDVSLTEDGRMQVTHREYGSESGFQVSSSTDGILGRPGEKMSVSVAGRDIKGTINGESATGKGQILTGNKGTRCVEGLSVRFRPPSGSLLNGQADPETGTSSIPKEGILVGQVLVNQNSLRFQTGGNQNQTVSVSVNAVNTENLGRGIENTSGFNSLMDINLLDFESAQDSLKLIDKAIDQITSARGDLGAFQKNTLESNLSNLRIAHENLTSSY